jgi:hypothetical protein
MTLPVRKRPFLLSIITLFARLGCATPRPDRISEVGEADKYPRRHVGGAHAHGGRAPGSCGDTGPGGRVFVPWYGSDTHTHPQLLEYLPSRYYLPASPTAHGPDCPIRLCKHGPPPKRSRPVPAPAALPGRQARALGPHAAISSHALQYARIAAPSAKLE